MTNKITIEEAARQLRAALNRRELVNSILRHATMLAAMHPSMMDVQYGTYLDFITNAFNKDISKFDDDLSENLCSDSSSFRDEFRSLQELATLTERVGELEEPKATVLGITSSQNIEAAIIFPNGPTHPRPDEMLGEGGDAPMADAKAGDTVARHKKDLGAFNLQFEALKSEVEMEGTLRREYFDALLNSDVLKDNAGLRTTVLNLQEKMEHEVKTSNDLIFSGMETLKESFIKAEKTEGVNV